LNRNPSPLSRKISRNQKSNHNRATWAVTILAEILGTGSSTLVYDSAGRMTTGPSSSTLTYNLAGQLATVNVFGSTGTYVYDGFGWRVTAQTGTGPTITQTYDQAGHYLERSAHDVSTDYVWLEGLPVAAIKPTATPVVSALHTNNIGAPVKATSAAQGSVWTAFYAPCGVAGISGATITNDLRYPGVVAVSGSNFMTNGFRTNSTQDCFYLEPDLIGSAGGTNRYTYAANNPLKYTDPSGLFTRNLWIIGGTAVAGGFAGYEVGHNAESAAVGFIAGAASAGINAQVGKAIAAGGARMLALQTAAGTTAALGTVAINLANHNPDLLNDTVPSFAIGFIVPALSGDVIAGGYGLVEEGSLTAGLLSLNTNLLTIAGTIMDLGITARAEAANGTDPYLSAAIQASEGSAAGPYGGGVLVGSGDPCTAPAPRLQ
jgi:RHS repeat-associated protein